MLESVSNYGIFRCLQLLADWPAFVHSEVVLILK